jgi:hypothetical protein
VSGKEQDMPFTGSYRLGTENRWRVKEAYTVPIGAYSTKHYQPQKLLMTFTTSRDQGTEFYLHVEGQDTDGRYAVYQGQAWIFPDGHSGYGPYVLVDERVRKIFIQNGENGAVDVVVYETY